MENLPKAKLEIKHIGLGSFIKIYALIYLVYFAITFLFMLFPLLSLAPLGEAMTAILSALVPAAIGEFLVALLSVVLYNWIAKQYGGVKITAIDHSN